MTAAIPNAIPSDDPEELPEDLRGLPDYMVTAILQRRAEEEAEWQRRMQYGSEAAARALSGRGGSRNSASVVFSLRLGHREFETLQQRAAMRSIPPSVLARNLITCGLKSETGGDELAEARQNARELEALAAEVRRAGRR